MSNVNELITKTEALLDAATQGEWKYEPEAQSQCGLVTSGDDVLLVLLELGGYDDTPDAANGALIAHAPSALRQLIAEVRRLQVEIDSHEEWQREYCEEMKGGMP